MREEGAGHMGTRAGRGAHGVWRQKTWIGETVGGEGGDGGGGTGTTG